MSIASLSVDTAVGVVTALTGLIAAAVAATQLSYRHRMMRTATWAQEQVSSATGERKQHLENMQRWAQSEVVAATMIPAWKYVEAIVNDHRGGSRPARATLGAVSAHYVRAPDFGVSAHHPLLSRAPALRTCLLQGPASVSCTYWFLTSTQ